MNDGLLSSQLSTHSLCLRVTGSHYKMAVSVPKKKARSDWENDLEITISPPPRELFFWFDQLNGRNQDSYVSNESFTPGKVCPLDM